MRDLGLKVYVYKTPNNMEEIKKAINDIAVLVGEQANAEKLIRQMDNKLKSVKNKVGSIKPSEQKELYSLEVTEFFTDLKVLLWIFAVMRMSKTLQRIYIILSLVFCLRKKLYV